MNEPTFCYFCGSGEGFVFVHGHYQCRRCRNVQIPCCEGAPSETTATPEEKPAALRSIDRADR